MSQQMTAMEVRQRIITLIEQLKANSEMAVVIQEELLRMLSGGLPVLTEAEKEKDRILNMGVRPFFNAAGKKFKKEQLARKLITLLEEKGADQIKQLVEQSQTDLESSRFDVGNKTIQFIKDSLAEFGLKLSGS